MNSFITDDFVELFAKLPHNVKRLAQKAYKQWKENPYHPSLQFKKVHDIESIWSVRIGLHWRVMGLKENDDIYWFWIGSHSDYDKLIDSF